MHSWREGYKNQKAEFDERIDDIAYRLAPTASEHVIYPRDRRIRRGTMAREESYGLVEDPDTTPPPLSSPENEGPIPHHPNPHALATLNDESLLQISQNQ
jgi:hypothetical protein